MTSIEAGKELVSILAGDKTVSSLVKDSIYPIIQNSGNALLPALFYRRVKLEQLRTKDGIMCDEVVLSVEGRASTYAHLAELSVALYQCFSREENGYTIMDASEDFDNDVYVVNFEILKQFER